MTKAKPRPTNKPRPVRPARTARPAATAAPDTVALTVRVPAALHASLARIHVRDGVPMSEQIRRALDAWVAERGEK